jgi:hypothetical protein
MKNYEFHSLISNFVFKKALKRETIRVADCGGPWGCDTSRFPHLLENQLRNGGEVAGLTRRPLFTPQEDSYCSFLLEAESAPQGRGAAGSIR